MSIKLKNCSLKECLCLEDDQKHCTIFIPTMTPLLKPNSKDCPYYGYDKKKDYQSYLNLKSQTMKEAGKRGRKSKTIIEDVDDSI
jgi:hypothetical protein